MNDNRGRRNFITDLENILYTICYCKKKPADEVAVEVAIDEELKSGFSRQRSSNQQKSVKII
jgi:hypothetical protein